jgi:hypothetical protein
MSKSPLAAAPTPPDHGVERRKLAGIVLGLTAVIALMVLAYAGPALNAGPKDLPLAVSGPEPAVGRLISSLDAGSPGAFEVTAFDSAEGVADQIREGKAIGGIAVSESGVALYTAAGAGAPYLALLNGVGAQLEASGHAVTYSELAPTTEDDPAGSGVATLGLPLIFGGMASAAALLLAYRGSVTSRVMAAFTLAVLEGFAAAAILQFVFGSFDGSYWLTAAALSAGIAAISFTVLGLGLLIGYPGIAVGAVLMLFVSNPLSGLASGPAWLPQPWGEIGQYLPVGATASAIRSAAYFDGSGSAHAGLVLAAWALCGLALALAAGRRRGQVFGHLDDGDRQRRDEPAGGAAALHGHRAERAAVAHEGVQVEVRPRAGRPRSRSRRRPGRR